MHSSCSSAARDKNPQPRQQRVAPPSKLLDGKSSEACTVKSCDCHRESIQEGRLESRAPKQRVCRHTSFLQFPLDLFHRMSLTRPGRERLSHSDFCLQDSLPSDSGRGTEDRSLTKKYGNLPGVLLNRGVRGSWGPPELVAGKKMRRDTVMLSPLRTHSFFTQVTVIATSSAIY